MLRSMAEGRWLTTAVSACLGGMVGGLLVWYLVRPAGPAGGEPTAEPAQSAAQQRNRLKAPASIEDRLESVEARVASVQRRETARAALAAYNVVAQAAQTGQEGGADTSLAPVIDQDDPTFEQAVRGVLDRVQEQREAERTMRRKDRARRLTDLLAAELQLTEAQRQGVEQALTDQFEAFRQLRRPPPDAGVRRPITRLQWREQADAIRQATDRKLGEVLSDGQMQLFREIRDDEGFGFGPGRRERGGAPR